VVAARWHNPGDLVDSSDTDPVLRLIDPRRLVVEAQVPLSDLPGLEVASPARVFPPNGAPAETGRLASRPAAVDSATSAVKLRIDFTQPTRLASGTPVRVEIFGPRHDNVIWVPNSAVVQEGPSSFVYVVDQKQQAHRKEVEVGIVADGKAEIQSGVEVGDRVIVEAQSALPDGAAVSLGR
jgi:RND family efflux transporter MFP subunit